MLIWEIGHIFTAYMNKGLISIGSNKNRNNNLACCQQILKTIFPDIVFSNISVTKPYGNNYRYNFINQLAFIHTIKEKEEVICLLKSLETDMGRTISDKKKGIVIIDLDLVIWNKEILKPEDVERGYIKGLLPGLSDAMDGVIISTDLS